MLNPGYFVGCGSSVEEPKFQYGAAEMTELALAANDSFEVVDGAQRYRVDLEIAPQRAKVASAGGAHADGLFGMTAHACGDRQLFATASACIDSSSMPLTGKLTVVRTGGTQDEILAQDVPVQGTLMVPSLVLDVGMMDLQYVGGRMHLEGKYRGAYRLDYFDLAPFLGTQP